MDVVHWKEINNFHIKLNQNQIKQINMIMSNDSVQHLGLKSLDSQLVVHVTDWDQIHNIVIFICIASNLE